jgi:hypothetical protein
MRFMILVKATKDSEAGAMPDEKGKGTFVDGPFTESKELIAGYTIIQVKSREEGIEWAKRFPSPHGDADGEIEIRQLFELDDFAPTESIERFREMGLATKK